MVKMKEVKSNMNKVIHTIFKNKSIRRETVRKNLVWFMSLYFPHYLIYPLADFQRQILKDIANDSITTLAIVAFRGSGKSTFCSLMLPIWSAIGVHAKKHILIVCQTQQRAQLTLNNIKIELESNEQLIADFGPFVSEKDEWSANSLVLAHYDTRITVVSVGESVRGMRHKQHRPDLIICDDIEDVPSARNQDSRDKLWQFVNGELIPAGNTNTKQIFIGNLVHEDSLMMRMKRAITLEKIRGTYREYPLHKGDGVSLWPGKFKTQEDIEMIRKSLTSENDFLREYLLQIVPEGNQIVKPEHILYYDIGKPIPYTNFLYYVISIDPAVSQEHTADKTAITVYRVYRENRKLLVLVDPHPVNLRMGFPEIIEKTNTIIVSLGKGAVIKILIEGGSSQKGLAQMFDHYGIHAKELLMNGNDKRTRLEISSLSIRNGTFRFPSYGAEELIQQILHFGVERYDDLVDSFTQCCFELMEKESSCTAKPVVIDCTGMYRSPTASGGLKIMRSKDWADEEDEQIFAQIRKRRGRHTI